MQIDLIGGYFVIREDAAGEVSRFASLFEGLEFESVDDYFTFSFLKDAPRYSLKGQPYLGATALKTYAGAPWDVMRENELVYNFNTGTVVPRSSITQRVEITPAANYFLSSGLILPGSLTDEGERITDYSAWYLFDSNKFRYSEVISE